MAEHDLMTAQYFQPDDEASAESVATAIEESPPAQASPTAVWAGASRLISVVAGAAFVAAVMGLVVPYLTSAAAGKKTSPIDWLIRLGGGTPDQTFEKWVRDSAKANEQEWQQRYRESPVYQLDPGKPIEWRFEPPPTFQPSGSNGRSASGS